MSKLKDKKRQTVRECHPERPRCHPGPASPAGGLDPGSRGEWDIKLRQK